MAFEAHNIAEPAGPGPDRLLAAELEDTAGGWPDALLEALPDLVLVAGSDGRIVRRNVVADNVLGDQLPVGGPAAGLLELIRDSERLQEQARAVLDRQQTYRGAFQMSDRNGRFTPYTAAVHPLPDGGCVIVIRDTVAAREREAVERQRDSSDAFVSRLGHELRTPLNAVLGFAQLLELEPLSAEQRADVQRILTGGRHMQALLDEVLDLSRVRGGGTDLDVASVPLLEVVRGAVDLVAGLAERRGIALILDIQSGQAGAADEPPEAAPENIVVRADRRRLTQVLLNLIDNAVKYGRAGGKVTVRLGAPAAPTEPVPGAPYVPRRAWVEVGDDGPGIAPESLERLFQPFERLGAERTAVVGTGLGLVLSRALVTAMNGSLVASSDVGSGTVLRMELDAVPGAGPRHDRQVLHVTDDPSAAALVDQALRGRLGAEVMHLHDADAVPAAVRDQQPAVVLIDDELAGTLTSDLVRRLAADSTTATVPVVVLSAETDPRIRLRMRAAGAVQVLDVPFDVRALLDAVARYLTVPRDSELPG